MIKLATVFSGIGAIEQSLRRLGIDYNIVFACDNGDVELDLLDGEDLREYKTLKKLRSKKQLKMSHDIMHLGQLGAKENAIAESIRLQIQNLPSKLEKKKAVDNLYKSHSRQTNFVKKSLFSQLLRSY